MPLQLLVQRILYTVLELAHYDSKQQEMRKLFPLVYMWLGFYIIHIWCYWNNESWYLPSRFIRKFAGYVSSPATQPAILISSLRCVVCHNSSLLYASKYFSLRSETVQSYSVLDVRRLVVLENSPRHRALCWHYLTQFAYHTAAAIWNDLRSLFERLQNLLPTLVLSLCQFLHCLSRG